MLLLFWKTGLSTLDFGFYRTWYALTTVLGYFWDGFPISWCNFWSWAMFGVQLSDSTEYSRNMKCRAKHHTIVHNVIYNLKTVTYNHRIYYYEGYNHWVNICDQWVNLCVRYTNIEKGHCQSLIIVLNSGRLDELMCMLLRGYQGTVDSYNDRMTWVILRLEIWIQYGWFIKDFKKFSNCSDGFCLVYGIISTCWPETCKGRLFYRKEGTDSWKGQKQLKVSNDQNICRDHELGDINVILYFKSHIMTGSSPRCPLFYARSHLMVSKNGHENILSQF